MYNLDDDEISFELFNGEVVLGAMSFPNDINLIVDQNIWIADTGASTDSIPYS